MPFARGKRKVRNNNNSIGSSLNDNPYSMIKINSAHFLGICIITILVYASGYSNMLSSMKAVTELLYP